MVTALTRRGAIGVLCGVLLVALPAEASAKRIFDIEHRSVAVKLSLHGSHGYRIEIESTSRRRIQLTASKGDTLAEYEVLGRATRHGLRANFGRLGRVAVRFRRVGKPRISRPPFGLLQCKGRSPIRETGRFEGTIRFRGEEGFTELSAQGAKGSVVRRFKRRCGVPGHKRPWLARRAGDSPSSSATALVAVSKDRDRRVSFGVFKAEAESRGGKRNFSIGLAFAGTSERRGRIAIRRAAIVESDPGSILASPFGVQPVTATVNLPRPFAGTAAYREEAGLPPSWTGTLHVRLPGADVPLTGTGFTATLCHERNLEKFDRCLNRAGI